MSTVSEIGNRTVKVKSKVDPNHFMVGKEVRVLGETGEIATVIKHELAGETYRRVLVNLDDGREVNVGPDDLEVIE